MLIKVSEDKWVHHDEIVQMYQNGRSVVFFLKNKSNYDRYEITIQQVLDEAIK